jgi:hypothetical protein
MRKERKIVKVSVYMDEELIDRLSAWRVKHMPLQTQTKAIVRILEDRIEQDEKNNAPNH